MTPCHHPQSYSESHRHHGRPASFTEDRMQALSHLSPEQLRAVFQMLAPTMREVQQDNEATLAPNRIEEVIARYALQTGETVDLFTASDDAVSD